MDPLQRREPLEKCASEYCAQAALSQAAQTPQETQDALDRNLEESTEALKRCIKKLLNSGDTNDLAHQLIGSALTFAEPQEAAIKPAAASDTARNGGAAASAAAANNNNTQLLALSALNGIVPNKIAGNLSLARLDLVKLGARLPAEENDFRLEALDDEWQLYLRTLYSLTAVISILLNVITVIVLYRAKPSELRKYLINLAIGDLLMSCFSIPFTYTEYMLGYWDYPPILCPVVKFVVTLSVYVSVCTMVVIGVNRHVAILYPLKKCSERAWKCSKNAVICAIWLSGIIISSPEYLMFKSTQFCYNQRYLHDCRNMWGDPFSYYYTIFIFMTTFVIPFVLLCYLYSSIGIQLKHRELPGNADASRDLTMQTKRAKVVKMLIVVVVVFGIFWLPLQTFTLITFIFPHIRQVDFDSASYNLFVGTYFTFHWMSMAHSCLNPLIYCFMNPKFRKDLRALICGRRWPPGAGGAGGASGPNGAGPNGAGRAASSSQLNRSQRQRHHFDNSHSTLRAAPSQPHWPAANQAEAAAASGARNRLTGSLKLGSAGAANQPAPLDARGAQRAASCGPKGAREPPAPASGNARTIIAAQSGNNVSQAAPNGRARGPTETLGVAASLAPLANGESAAAAAATTTTTTSRLGGGFQLAPSKSIEITTAAEARATARADQREATAALETRQQTQLVVEGRPGGGVTKALRRGQHQRACPRRAASADAGGAAAAAAAATTQRSGASLALAYRNKLSQLTRLVRASCSSSSAPRGLNGTAGIASV